MNITQIFSKGHAPDHYILVSVDLSTSLILHCTCFWDKLNDWIKFHANPGSEPKSQNTWKD